MKVIELPLEDTTKQKWDFKGCYRNGRAKVQRGKWYNFVDENNQIISSVWFVEAVVFMDGYALVRTEKGCNLLDINGRLQSDTFFDQIIGVYGDGFYGSKYDQKEWTKIILDPEYQYFDKCQRKVEKIEDGFLPEDVMWVWNLEKLQIK